MECYGSLSIQRITSVITPRTHQRSAVLEPQTAQQQPLPPNQISKADCQSQSVTPVRGPRTLELGSGKVAGKVLIVDHMG